MSTSLFIFDQAKHAFEQLREEIRNRNSEDINMLRISLDAQIEGKIAAFSLFVKQLLLHSHCPTLQKRETIYACISR